MNNHLGVLFDRIGDYNVAGEYYQKSLNIRTRALGPDHVLVGDTMNDYAVALYHNGHFDEAYEKMKIAVEIKIRAVSTREHPTVAYSLYRMGDVLRKQGKDDEALETYTEALQVQTKTLNEFHTDVASTCNSMAVCYYNQGHFAQSLGMYERALKINISAVGNDHAEVGETYNDMAAAYNKLGDCNRASEYYEKALKIRLKKFGERNKDTAQTYAGMADVFYTRSEYEKSREFYLKALAIRVEVLSPNHRDVGIGHYRLGHTYRKVNKFAEAGQCYAKALEIFEHIFGKQHRLTGSVYNAKAVLRDREGHYDEAASLFEIAHAIRIDTLGAENLSIGHTLTDWYVVYMFMHAYIYMEGNRRVLLIVFARACSRLHSCMYVCLLNFVWGIAVASGTVSFFFVGFLQRKAASNANANTTTTTTSIFIFLLSRLFSANQTGGGVCTMAAGTKMRWKSSTRRLKLKSSSLGLETMQQLATRSTGWAAL